MNSGYVISKNPPENIGILDEEQGCSRALSREPGIIAAMDEHGMNKTSGSALNGTRGFVVSRAHAQNV